MPGQTHGAILGLYRGVLRMQRLLLPLASCLLVSVASAGLMALADRPQASGVTAAAATERTAASPSGTHFAPGSGGTSPSADEAAARHAKRTACLKNARVKKLVGAQRTSYVKQCMAAKS